MYFIKDGAAYVLLFVKLCIVCGNILGFFVFFGACEIFEYGFETLGLVFTEFIPRLFFLAIFYFLVGFISVNFLC